MKYLNFVLKGFLFSLFSGITAYAASTEVKGKCSEIQTYLKEQKISYENNIRNCVVNDQGEIINLSINNQELSEDNVKKLLSYNTIETLSYYIYYGEVPDSVVDSSGPKFKDFPSNLKSLPNLKYLKLGYDRQEQVTHTFMEIKKEKIKENVLKDLKIKSLDLYGIDLSNTNIKEINTLESLTFYECSLNEFNLDDLKNNKNLTELTISFKDRNAYSGTYNPDRLNLSNVKSLKKLTMKEFNIGQDIMNDLTKLTSLEELNISESYFYKSNIDKQLVASFDKFTSLSKLTIGFGKSRDDYEEDDGFKKYIDLKLPKNLKSLDISGVDITDNNINVISSISSLKELVLKLQECTSKPDINKLINLKNLEFLNLGGNNKLEEITIDFTKFNLKKLYLFSFKLPKSFEEKLFALDQLEELSLENCKRDDPLNLDPIENLKKLNTLIISNKYDDFNILNNIPKSLFNMTNLKKLYISDQNIEKIPEELGNLKNLEYLHISGGKIKSEIPQSLNNLKKLNVVYLGGKISGKTLTIDNLETCYYSNTKDVCIAKDMPCFEYTDLKKCDDNGDVTNKTTITTTTTITRPSTTKTSNSTSTGRCGKDYGGAVCKSGYCCSKYGYCGTTEDHCELTKGCQSEFGDCSTKKSGQCGKGIGSCPSGYCCSKYGWCGKSSDHCLASKGCQSSFGECKNDNESVKGKCGNGIGKCPSGYCCSKYGWCGKTLDHCSVSKGCQSSFGECKKESVNGKCGKGNGICPSGYCCSKYGWCGKSKDYCGTGCQSEFGKCD